MSIKSILIFFVFALCSYSAWEVYSEKSTALNECVEDISNKCSSILDYAFTLEKENARLNRLLKHCQEN